ncbi:MAG: lipopolysaccharide biosynthesis protein [Christensenellales bacterium]|jgi:O-antigen/teichoic acid export membrane protein
MSGYKKRMLKTTAIYFIGQMSTRVLSILLLPLYTYHIATEAYGYFDIVQTYLSVAVPFLFLEVWSALLRFSLEEERPEDKGRVITNSTFVALLGLGLFTLVYWIAAGWMKIDYAVYVYAYAIAWMFQLMAMAACRGLQDNLCYALSGVIGVAVVTGISLLGVFVLGWGIETLFISNIASFVVQGVFVILRVKLYRYVNFRLIDRRQLKRLLRFCIPLSINSAFYWLLNSVNRVIIVSYLGYSANGVYSVANKLGNIVTALVGIFMLSWQETVFKLDYKERNEIQDIYDQEFKNIKFLLALGVLALLPFTRIFFNLLIGGEYEEAFGLVPPMYFMVFLTSINSFIDVVYSAVHDTRSLLYVKIIGGVVNLAVILALVGSIGLYASPVAIICAQAVTLVMNKLFLRRHVRVKVGALFMGGFLLLFAAGTAVYLSQGRLVNLLWLLLLGAGGLFAVRKVIAQALHAVRARLSPKKEEST